MSVFLAATLFFAYLTPFELGNHGGPDEVTHYHYNVEFILNHHRLPLPGQDDLAAFATCFTNPPGRRGKVPCMISYTVYPGLNYVLAAGGAAVARALAIEPYWGARALSWLWGATFVVLLFLACKLVAPGRYTAMLATAAVALVPQVVFIASYVNQDIHSLAISALLAYGLLLLDRRGADRYSIGVCGIALGLLFSAKYNYFVYVPVALIALTILYRRGTLTGRQMTMLGGLAAATALATSGYWYIRNLVVLHDLLGQRFMLAKMAEYHPLGQPHPLDLQAFTYLGLLDFYNLSFQSFFARFGSMNLALPDGAYDVAKLAIAAVAVGSVVECAGRREWRGLAMIGAFVAFLGVSYALLIYNSLQLDFQPQGRYLFPVVVPAALLLASLMRRSTGFTKYAVVSLALTLYLLGESVLLYLRTFSRV